MQSDISSVTDTYMSDTKNVPTFTSIKKQSSKSLK
jgi:hypothetical protein